MCELFFAFLFEIFKEIAVRTEAVFASDRVFEKESFERLQSERHVTTKENKETDTREVGKNMPHRGQTNNGVESGLAKDDGGKKGGDIQWKNGFFGKFLISIENCGNKANENQKTHEFGTEIIGIFAIVVAVVKGPEQGRGDGDFDMFPGGFVDGSEETNGTVLACEIIKKMGKGACGGDSNDANPHDQSVIHGDIVA